jgi:hypothetical protein
MNPIFNNSPVKVNLTKAQVEAMITQAVRESFPNLTADKISFKVSIQIDMRHEVSGTTFEGVDIVLKPRNTLSNSNSSYWDR